ncbi:hypothetical protein EIP86_007247 [Pleurotus ostreatoroseus]|nr:hypothetical protein EIP86_007247 [Pleurotus ostreatoroseus]
MTNGGGMSEEERCRRLTARLGHEIKPSQFIQAHTVLKTVVDKYADEPVLVLGGRNDDLRKVAEGYGFKQVYTTLDVKAWDPSVWPFHDLTDAERASTKQVDFAHTPIRAVFVYHDPRNWALDVQVLCDVLQSGGLVGGPYTDDAARRNEVELVFCNPDLIWRNEFERPRIGQGAFRVAFQAVYKELTGTTYPYTQLGKPSAATYAFAETVLHKLLQDTHGPTKQLPAVYMIGGEPAAVSALTGCTTDHALSLSFSQRQTTPNQVRSSPHSLPPLPALTSFLCAADIAGANAAGWHSVLVHTGVYDPAHGPPAHAPTHEAADVEAAVRWAVGRELAKRGTN